MVILQNQNPRESVCNWAKPQGVILQFGLLSSTLYLLLLSFILYSSRFFFFLKHLVSLFPHWFRWCGLLVCFAVVGCFASVGSWMGLRRLDGCHEWVGFITAVWGGIWVGFVDVVPRPKAVWVMLGTSLQWVAVWPPGMVAINGTLHRDVRQVLCFLYDIESSNI